MLILLVTAVLLATGTSRAAPVEAQRQAFIEVYPEAELGNWQPAREREAVLSDYVLWPDLQAAYFRASLAKPGRDDAQIRAFLEQHATLKPARELRYRYALQLAAEGRTSEYLDLYQQYFLNLGIAKLDCLALDAQLRTGGEQALVNRAQQLWLVGTSQAKECDPVFDYLRSHALLGEDLHQQRYALAIEARQFGLARYLSKPLAPDYRETATDWLAAQNQSQEFVRTHADRADSETHRRQLVFAVTQLAYRQPEIATGLWQDIRAEYAFTPAQLISVERHLALWWARRHVPGAQKMLQRLRDDAVDAEVRRWRTRTSLRQQNWNDVISGIDTMPAKERVTEQWRYWRAYALLQLGDDEAESELQELATERSYYGFLAADELRDQYQFSHAEILLDEAAVDTLAVLPSLIRARELFYVGLDGRGRSEWDAAITQLSIDEKAQAVILAQRWGWHSRAIATATKAGTFDDLHVRFPLPYKESFAEFSTAAQVRQSWAYGIARSESLFMRDVRSSAGAIGLMQLMPATGRSAAKEINYPYAGRITLTDPVSNIRLGTYYLGQMYERFGGNKVLATAAYNAGPRNVEEWLPEAGRLDARIWIENIPYSETRKYVRRVLETDVIFNWRLTGRVRRVSSDLAAVAAPEVNGRPAQTD